MIMSSNDYIIGIPSGEIIEIEPQMINSLKQRGFITYNLDFRAHTFQDKEYNLVFQFVSSFQSLNKKDFKYIPIGDSSPFPANYSKKDLSNKVSDFMGNQRSIKSYKIEEDFMVSVKGSIIVIGDNKLSLLPFSFKSIEGDFIIKDCRLRDLRGCPSRIVGNFDISGNEIFELTHGPVNVGGDYNCSDNVLADLTGSPDIIRGDFDCSNNLLLSLKGSPMTVAGVFDCTKNKHLVTLQYAPSCKLIVSDVKKLRKFRDGYNQI